MTHHIPHDSPSLPAPLAESGRAPLGLWVRGALPAARGVTVVGTRRPTADGLRWARQIGRALAERGVAVWSGGAVGVDQAAHQGALDAGGVTVVCAPGGTDRPFPADAGSLWESVVAKGAVVSLVPPDEPPPRSGFFARNALMATMTDATILVECPLASGARNTTAHARRLGRPVLLLSAPFDSPFVATVRAEERLGGRVVASMAELLGALHVGPARVAPATSAAAARLLGVLGDVPRHADALAAASGLDAGTLAVAQLELVLEGLAVDEPGLGLRRS